MSKQTLPVAPVSAPAVSPYRAEVLRKMEEYERLGGEYFFRDVETDPPSHPLEPDEVDYLCHKLRNKCKRFFANILRRKMSRAAKQHFNIRIEGAENLASLRDVGAIFTSNHFSPFENVAVCMASSMTPGKHRFYSVIREGNYFMTGAFGFLLKNSNTLPLSSCMHTMGHFNAAIGRRLAQGGHVLVYPEQAMWYNYKKPRPYRIGAFHMAAKNHVPVVPCFITLAECGGYEEDGTPRVHYTLHILPPIYPDPSKSVHENADMMMRANAALTRATYERVYGIPLTYTTEAEGAEQA